MSYLNKCNLKDLSNSKHEDVKMALSVCGFSPGETKTLMGNKLIFVELVSFEWSFFTSKYTS